VQAEKEKTLVRRGFKYAIQDTFARLPINEPLREPGNFFDLELCRADALINQAGFLRPDHRTLG
jgi:hypothetical protein